MQQALWIGLTEICTKSIFLKQEQDLRKQGVLDDKHEQRDAPLMHSCYCVEEFYSVQKKKISVDNGYKGHFEVMT